MLENVTPPDQETLLNLLVRKTRFQNLTLDDMKQVGLDPDEIKQKIKDMDKTLQENLSKEEY